MSHLQALGKKKANCTQRRGLQPQHMLEMQKVPLTADLIHLARLNGAAITSMLVFLPTYMYCKWGEKNERNS